MYYRNAAKCFAKSAYVATSTAGGFVGMYKGFDIVEKNRFRYYRDLSTISNNGDNVYAFITISACIFIGSTFGPPLLIASPFLYPIAPNYMKNLVSALRNDSS